MMYETSKTSHLNDGQISWHDCFLSFYAFCSISEKVHVENAMR